jgi:hypothetical protein
MIPLNDNIQVNAAKPIDRWEGPFNSQAEAIAIIPPAFIYPGRPVTILENGVAVKYHFADGVNLEPLGSGAGATVYIVVKNGSNGLSIDGQGRVVFQNSRLLGKSGYLIESRQLNAVFSPTPGVDIAYNSALGKFTILVPGFTLSAGYELIVWLNLNNVAELDADLIQDQIAALSERVLYMENIGAGQDGKSAYELWLDVGNTGSMAVYLASLIGPKGSDGARGADGAKGEKGDKGEPGVAGADGAQGLKGDQGIPGIQGPKGETGAQGQQGIQGLQGIPGPVNIASDADMNAGTDNTKAVTPITFKNRLAAILGAALDLAGIWNFTTGLRVNGKDVALKEDLPTSKFGYSLVFENPANDFPDYFRTARKMNKIVLVQGAIGYSYSLNGGNSFITPVLPLAAPIDVAAGAVVIHRITYAITAVKAIVDLEII